jgi:hypothetical protein
MRRFERNRTDRHKNADSDHIAKRLVSRAIRHAQSIEENQSERKSADECGNTQSRKR